MQKRRYKVGTKIVEDGRVHRIFKSAKRKDLEGKRVQTIYFRPYFKKESDNFLTSSIPLVNTELARIRMAITRVELVELVHYLEKTARKNLIELDILKEKLSRNNARKTAQVLKVLWVDKNNEETSFSPTKKGLYEKALRSFAEEYALIRNTSLDSALEKTEKSLGKALH